VRSIIQIDFTSSDSPCSRNIAKQNTATEVQFMGEFPVYVCGKGDFIRNGIPTITGSQGDGGQEEREVHALEESC